MRSLILFLFCLFFYAGISYAAPCYGTRLPEEKQVFIGLQNHTLFKRYLEDDFGKVRDTQEFFLLSYGLRSWFSVDLKGGAGNIKQRPAGASEVDYPYGFAGGYGFRLKFYAQQKQRAVFGFQHISVHPKSKHVGSVKNKAILDDWQASLLFSRDFLKCTPYIGVKWSRLDYIHTVAGERKRRMSDLTKSIGAIFGTDIFLNKKTWINIEAQAFDTQALAVSLNYGF